VSTLLLTGTLTGSGTFTADSLLTWNSGLMTGTGVTNADGGILIDSDPVTLDTRTLNNAAGQTTTLANSGNLTFAHGGTFNNNGTFLAQRNGIGFSNGFGGGIFNNFGTFTRNTGADDF